MLSFGGVSSDVSWSNSSRAAFKAALVSSTSLALFASSFFFFSSSSSLLWTASSWTRSEDGDPFKSMGMAVTGYSNDRKIQVKHKTSAVLNARNNSTLRSEDFSLEDDAGGSGWNSEDDDI